MEIQPVRISAPRTIPLAPPEVSLAGDLRRYWRMLCRHYVLLIGSVVGCGLVSLLYSARQTPVYRASVTVEITGLGEGSWMSRLDPAGMMARYPDENYVQTQVELLRSRALLARVLEKHGLLKLAADKAEAAPAPAEAKTRGPVARVLGLLRPNSSKDALTRASSALRIKANKQTRVIEISYDMVDPRLAAKIANGLANEFIGQARETQWESAQQTNEWLKNKLRDLKLELARSESKLQTYASNSDLLYAEDKNSLSMEKLRQLQTELSHAQTEVASKRVQYEGAATGTIGALPQMLDDPTLREHQSKLDELKRQLADLSSTMTPEYYKVTRLKAQIEQFENIAKKHRASILERIQVEYESARQKERALADAYTAQSKLVHKDQVNGVQYDLLRREADANRQLYDSLLQKIGETSFASAMGGTSVRVVDPAETPSAPVRPNGPLNLFAGLSAGLAIGFMLVVLIETTDRTFRSPFDTVVYLNIRELGSIPAIDSDPFYKQFKKNQGIPDDASVLDGPVWQPLDTGSNGAQATGATAVIYRARNSNVSELMLWHAKRSLFAESFRAAAVSLLFTPKDGVEARVVVITSAMPKEGKSTVTANLGIALARMNRRTLLIDGDMRCSRLHTIFGLEGSPGLDELLMRVENLDDIPSDLLVCPSGVPNLSVIPNGKPLVEPGDFLNSAGMKRLLLRCRGEFDHIIIDSPPMSQIPDARVLGRMADGVVLLIRAEATSRERAQAALHRLEQDGTFVFGAILNGWAPTKHEIADYYKYYHPNSAHA